MSVTLHDVDWQSDVHGSWIAKIFNTEISLIHFTNFKQKASAVCLKKKCTGFH